MRPNLALVAMLVGCQRTPEDFGRAATSASPNGTVTIQANSEGRMPTIVQSCPADPEPGLRALPTVSINFPEATDRVGPVTAELARGDHDTTRGLMYRTSMPVDHGMLFDLPRADHNFWMHNTCIPLDLLFIDADRIVGIVENAPTLNDDPRGVGALSSFVLELNGGWCKHHGVRVGQRVVVGPLPR
jgi:uncharacterized membrane protein (UPF0127 family)